MKIILTDWKDMTISFLILIPSFSITSAIFVLSGAREIFLTQYYKIALNSMFIIWMAFYFLIIVKWHENIKNLIFKQNIRQTSWEGRGERASQRSHLTSFPSLNEKKNK